MDAAGIPHRPTTLAWVGWGVLICLAVAAADAMLWVLGSLLSTGAQAAPQQVWRIFPGVGMLRFMCLAVMMLVVVLGHRLLPTGGISRWLALAALVLVATAAGWIVFVQSFCDIGRWLGFELRYSRYCGSAGFPQRQVPVMVVRQLQFALPMVGLYEFASRSRRVAEALHEAGLRQMSLARDLAAGRAQLLQAQIEPHFLFNSLANVRRLVRTDAAAAASMLADLLRYLQEALPRLRETESTLGQEIELVRAFLDVHGVRMGPRLRYDIVMPETLAQLPVPPMLLLTLVENALKHGLQPLPEGGCIQVGASRSGAVLTLTVGDTGRGMGDASGHGTGLANIRARLRALHGAAAALSLQVNEPRGVRATITLPAVPG